MEASKNVWVAFLFVIHFLSHSIQFLHIEGLFSLKHHIRQRRYQSTHRKNKERADSDFANLKFYLEIQIEKLKKIKKYITMMLQDCKGRRGVRGWKRKFSMRELVSEQLAQILNSLSSPVLSKEASGISKPSSPALLTSTFCIQEVCFMLSICNWSWDCLSREIIQLWGIQLSSQTSTLCGSTLTTKYCTITLIPLIE